jgi:hypothetical protein
MRRLLTKIERFKLFAAAVLWFVERGADVQSEVSMDSLKDNNSIDQILAVIDDKSLKVDLIATLCMGYHGEESSIINWFNKLSLQEK